jgi:hypothetical protein
MGGQQPGDNSEEALNRIERLRNQMEMLSRNGNNNGNNGGGQPGQRGQGQAGGQGEDFDLGKEFRQGLREDFQGGRGE